jgi:hypothetical protein
MEVDEFAEGPVGVAVATSAVVFSPGVRRALRRGLVYGVAGVLTAGDAVTGLARGIRRGVRGGGAAESEGQETEAGKRGARVSSRRRKAKP